MNNPSKTMNIKEICKSLGLTQKELAEMIGVTPRSLNNFVSTGRVTNQTKQSIRLVQRIFELEKQLEELKEFKERLKALT